LGAPITTSSSTLARGGSSGSFHYPRAPASGYPLPANGIPPPAGYPTAYPEPNYAPYQTQSMQSQQFAPQNIEAANSTELAAMKRQLEEAASQAKITEMERQLHAEKMKNDMRKEIDMSSRLAATEAAQRVGSGGAPIVVNNNNSSATGAAGGGAGAGAAEGMSPDFVPVYRAPSGNIMVPTQSQPVVYLATEKYCGPWSWLVGCCILPCVCCCPIDTRPVSNPSAVTVVRK
jgi:hypothetical protein